MKKMNKIILIDIILQKLNKVQTLGLTCRVFATFVLRRLMLLSAKYARKTHVAIVLSNLQLITNL
jgi:hypothetical protein